MIKSCGYNIIITIPKTSRCFGKTGKTIICGLIITIMFKYYQILIIIGVFILFKLKY